jgi:energy-coupling factor transporter ATP-binding protein EcfA2
MQRAVGLVDHSKGEEGRALPTLARDLGREGAIGLILGPPGSGKTATALDTARIWKAIKNGAVITNVESWDAADKHVTTATGLLDAMAEIQGPVLGVIDEGSQTLTSKGAEAEISDQFAKSLKMIRKKEPGDRYAKRGSLLLVGHTRKDTAADIRRLVTVAAEKPTRADAGRLILYESDGGKDGLEKRNEYRGITDTPEIYGEHEASNFDVDLGADQEADDGVDQEADAEEIRRDEQIRNVIRTLDIPEEERPSYRDVANRPWCDYSKDWVGERWREYERGEHTHLLDTDDDADR